MALAQSEQTGDDRDGKAEVLRSTVTRCRENRRACHLISCAGEFSTVSNVAPEASTRPPVEPSIADCPIIS
eukprot:51572-Eustigmatos_ZCMA.PRE.1